MKNRNEDNVVFTNVQHFNKIFSKFYIKQVEILVFIFLIY
jgi:hypothetical protein